MRTPHQIFYQLIIAASTLALFACSSTPISTAPAPIGEVESKSSVPPSSKPPGAKKTPDPAAPPSASLRSARFSDLTGWSQDNALDALPALLRSCDALVSQAAWAGVCSKLKSATPATHKSMREFIEGNFTVWQVINDPNSSDGLVTGYFEPELIGSQTPTSEAKYPIYAAPDDLLTIDLGDTQPDIKGQRVRGRLVGKKVVPYFTRSEIEAGLPQLSGKALAWVTDPVALFFMQVQGSGRITLTEGGSLRLGYADQNGYPYKSIGKVLVDRGELTLDQASMQGIQAWAKKNPQRLQELLNQNPSYVFFRSLPPPQNASDGPPGALGVPLLAGRSIAVDRSKIPLGAPVWLDTTLPNSKLPLRRLVLAQDTGGAIRGAVRADLYWGSGYEAGQNAGRMKQRGQMWVLWPKPAT